MIKKVSFSALVFIGLYSAVSIAGTIEGKVEATPPKYLEETVVYVKNVKSTAAPKAHAVDQKGMRFLPHIATITVGDTVDFLNHDKVDHNVYSSDGEGYNLGMIKPDAKGQYTFKKLGVYSQLCSVHPEMLSYIFVGENGYAATVNKTGHFAIKDVPPGTYQVAVWNSKLKAAEQSITVAADKPANASFALKK